MKYKCLDCGAVYDKKIEYCECGNNTFEEVFTSEEKYVEKQKTPPAKGEIISWGIFTFCLLLSLIILFILPSGRVKEVREQLKDLPQKTEKTAIPDIDKIWKDPEAPQPVEQSQPEPEPVVIIKKIIRRIETPAEPVKTQAVTKPVSQTPKAQQQTTTTNKPAPVSRQIPKTEIKKEQKPVVQKPKTTQPVVTPNPAVTRYKNILREVLLSKLAVGSISGEGTCVIEFSVDSAGKLINRKFVQYADNKAVNDAVYYMLMRVPTFQPPPSAYKGEPIKIKFHIDNGAYEISFQ